MFQVITVQVRTYGPYSLPETLVLTHSLRISLKTRTHAHTHTPVSYTHLDVYKRQVRYYLKYSCWRIVLSSDISVVNTLSGITCLASAHCNHCHNVWMQLQT